jgi:uncharacterized repeat protein (TIGR01451 family)
VSSLALIAGLVSAPPALAQPVGADLRASARAVPDAAAVGDDVTLNGSATNNGPAPATGVTLTFDLPQGLVFQAIVEASGTCSEDRPVVCQVGTLAPGQASQVRILTGLTRKGANVATVRVDAAEDDPNPANDQAAAEALGTGADCDRVGTVETDRLRAGRAGSVVCGLGGADIVLGGPRGDDLLGGTGNDALVGDAGRDKIDGGEGEDACAGDPGPGSERACEHAVFALAGSLPLVDLGTSTVGYGYHQSLFRTAIGLRPFGEHVVMGSRDRGTGSTTASDVVVGARARVTAPVTGQVVGVKRYLLYCERPDWKIVIRPDADPSIRVLVLHLGRPRVADGDEVTAGISSLGRARRADWPDSQVERYFPGRRPHVHVEVERDRASPTPGCSI